MTILELVLPIILFVLIAVLRQVGVGALCFASKKLFSRGQIENTRGENNGEQDDDNTPFKSSDLNQLINDNDNFCRNWNGGERMIYYTSGQEDKQQLDVVMERVRKYLEFICNEYNYNYKVPGSYHLELECKMTIISIFSN